MEGPRLAVLNARGSISVLVQATLYARDGIIQSDKLVTLYTRYPFIHSGNLVTLYTRYAFIRIRSQATLYARDGIIQSDKLVTLYTRYPFIHSGNLVTLYTRYAFIKSCSLVTLVHTIRHSVMQSDTCTHDTPSLSHAACHAAWSHCTTIREDVELCDLTTIRAVGDVYNLKFDTTETLSRTDVEPCDLTTIRAVGDVYNLKFDTTEALARTKTLNRVISQRYEQLAMFTI
ncbi:hypothetical protein J6590_101096 [Homalodisca vitripennis]|nr:hypothetical protein J6590_101096 [Homalodisca vitripennis]